MPCCAMCINQQQYSINHRMYSVINSLFNITFVKLHNYQACVWSSWKHNLAGNENYENAVTSNNIFDGTRSQPFPEFQRVGRSVFDASLDDSTSGVTAETNPQFEVVFMEAPSSEGWGGYSPNNDQWQISYNLLMCHMIDTRVTASTSN